MSEGFPYFDIILFAMIAAFLVLRLRGMLGRRDGHEGGYTDPMNRSSDNAKGDARGRDGETDRDDNVISLPDSFGGPRREEAKPAPNQEEIAESLGVEADNPLAAGITQIKMADPDFDPTEFVVGARVAFEMILNGFAQGDKKTLRGLLSDDVYYNFAQAIDDREQAGETLEETLVGIIGADIVEAEMDGRDALVTIKFKSEQITVTRDVDDRIIDGDPNAVTKVTDFWTFARDTRSRDPNWVLVATATED
ncbi:MAG: Tim44/TimA family putative adaptor protein [Magnetovibrionaceae bacterium]